MCVWFDEADIDVLHVDFTSTEFTRWPARTFCSVNSLWHAWVCYTLGSVLHPGTFLLSLQFYSQCTLTFWFLAYCLWFSLLLRFWCLYYLVVKCLTPMPCKKHILKIEAKKTRKRWEEMIYLIKTSSSWRVPFWSIDYESSLQDKGQGFNPQPGN